MQESTSLWNSRAFALWNGRGKIVKEAKVASELEALVYFFKELGFPVNRIGFKAGPLSQWLHAGLTQAGFEAVLLETRHVKAALSASISMADSTTLRDCTPRPC
jgi:transposase